MPASAPVPLLGTSRKKGSERSVPDVVAEMDVVERALAAGDGALEGLQRDVGTAPGRRVERRREDRHRAARDPALVALLHRRDPDRQRGLDGRVGFDVRGGESDDAERSFCSHPATVPRSADSGLKVRAARGSGRAHTHRRRCPRTSPVPTATAAPPSPTTRPSRTARRTSPAWGALPPSPSSGRCSTWPAYTLVPPRRTPSAPAAAASGRPAFGLGC